MKWFTSTSFEILTAGKHTATLFEETFASVTDVRLSDITDDVAVDAGSTAAGVAEQGGLWLGLLIRQNPLVVSAKQSHRVHLHTITRSRFLSVLSLKVCPSSFRHLLPFLLIKCSITGPSCSFCAILKRLASLCPFTSGLRFEGSGRQQEIV